MNSQIRCVEQGLGGSPASIGVSVLIELGCINLPKCGSSSNPVLWDFMEASHRCERSLTPFSALALLKRMRGGTEISKLLIMGFQ